MFGLHKLYSKQSLLRFLWKKVHRLEKSTPTPLVALQTNISYVLFSVETCLKLDFLPALTLFTQLHIIIIGQVSSCNSQTTALGSGQKVGAHKNEGALSFFVQQCSFGDWLNGSIANNNLPCDSILSSFQVLSFSFYSPNRF